MPAPSARLGISVGTGVLATTVHASFTSYAIVSIKSAQQCFERGNAAAGRYPQSVRQSVEHKINKMMSRRSGLFAAFFIATQAAHAWNGPVIEYKARIENDPCPSVLAAAVAAFNGNAPFFRVADYFGESTKDRAVIGPDNHQQVFPDYDSGLYQIEVLSGQSGGNRVAAFWPQDNSTAGFVYVIADYTDLMTLYHVYARTDIQISAAEFNARFLKDPSGAFKPRPLFSTSTPPLFFANRATGRQWLINGGDDALSEGWRVYALKENRPQLICNINFVPNPNRKKNPLPLAVQHFIKLFESSHVAWDYRGPARTTTDFNSWDNLAFRPWAMYSTVIPRAKIDAIVKQWAGAAQGRDLAAQQLTKSYDRAVPALARYYKREFGLSGPDAMNAAGLALEVAYGSHFFTVSDDDAQPIGPTPWDPTHPRAPQGLAPGP